MGFLDEWRDEQKLDKPKVEDIQDEHGEVGIRGKEQGGKGVSKSAKLDRYAKRHYNNTYRERNKHAINTRRRKYEQTPEGAFKKSRRRALSKRQGWDISLENWVNVWASCPKIYDDTLGEYRMAWTMRGNDIQRNTQMRRKDVSKGWHIKNVEIVYRNQPIPEHGIVAEWDWGRKAPRVEEDV